MIKQFFFLYIFLYLLQPNAFFAQESTNYFDIVTTKQREFDALLKKSNINTAITSLYKKQKKFARWQWFWQHRIDKKGDLNSYYKEVFANDNITELRNYEITNDKKATWKIIGPETYPKGTNPSGIKGIGRIDAIVVNPKNSNHVIIGARAGGIWETKNSNDSIPKWKCLTNNLPVFTVNDLKIINNTLYAATSNINPILSQGDTRYGLGIIKKKLNSDVWQLSNTTFEANDIAISTSNPKIMYAVGEKHIYKSVNAGDDWVKTAAPITNINTSKILLTNIAINPFDDAKIIVSGRLNFFYSTHHKEKDILLFKSDNGGKSWTNLTSYLEKFINNTIQKTGAKDKLLSLTTGLKNHISTFMYQQKLYVGIQQMYNPNLLYFVTLNKNWNNFTLYNSLSKQNTYYYKTDNVDLRFQVINDDEILVGNRKLRLINNKNHTIKNLDPYYRNLHQDIRAIHFNTKTSRLLLGTDGGINQCFRNNSSKKFENFSNLSGNLNLFLAFNMSYIHKNGKRTVRIGNQDTGYYRSDNDGEAWSAWSRFGSFGEGMVYTDPNDPEIVYRINAKGHGGNIHKSTNDGKTFKNPKIKTGNYVFSPLEIDKNNTNNLIFDNYKNYDRYTLSLSNNQLDSTVFIDNGIEKLDMGANLALALSKKDPEIFYVARKKFHFKDNGINNSLFTSKNFNFDNPSAIQYTELTNHIKKLDSTILNRAFITHIELNNNNKDELWISFGNLENGKKVFHSIDGGLHWKNISNNLPNVPVNIIKYDANNKQLYIGNDYGVYRFNKTSNQWHRYGAGLPIAIVTSIEIDNLENEIIASLHGRSVWTAPIINKQNYAVTSNETWDSPKVIDGDLIIKNDTSLTLNKTIVKADNIIIENGAELHVLESKIISNNKTAANYLNTNITIKPYASLNLLNSEIQHFNIDLNANSTFKIYGKRNSVLEHSIVTVNNYSTYLQNKKSQLVLKDTKIVFSENYKLGASPYISKIKKMKFLGNGSIKIKKSILNK